MNFTVQTLTRQYLEQHIEEFISLLHKNLKNEYWTSEHFLSDLPEKWRISQYVINETKNIIGFLIASDKVNNYHIHKFVVDHSYRNSGIGTLLLRNLLSTIDKDIMLKVSCKNTEAIQFYQQKGFIVSGQDGNMYHMILKLT